MAQVQVHLSRNTTSNSSLIIGMILVVLFIVTAFVSLFWTPHSPEAIDVTRRLLPPGSADYPFGTDRLGRDVLSQVMAGARTSLLVAVVSTGASSIPGVALGLLIAGASSGWQSVLLRLVDAWIAFPAILVALVLATVLGPGNGAAIIAIVVGFTPLFARVTAGPARQILVRDFVEAAFAYGRSRTFVLFRHVLPNIAPVLIVQASIMFAVAILIEAALAYLGLGAPRPTPSWGRLLTESQPLLNSAPTLVVFPGAAIMLAVLGFNLLGDGLRTGLDPRQKRHESGA